MAIRAFLFDFDGLILDTETASRAGWRWLYEQHGHELPDDLWITVVGYYADATLAGTGFQAITPTLIANTSSGFGGTRLASGGSIEVNPALAAVPAGASAVVMNVAAQWIVRRVARQA